MKLSLFPFLFFYLVAVCAVNAQCLSGQEEVSIEVKTDAYGYEVYWQLLPSSNACDSGTVFSGGNISVGCNGGGLQAQNPGGYANDTIVTEGPWCLTGGADYKIFSVDDYGDGGAKFTVYIAGFPMYDFSEDSTGGEFVFTAAAPPALDASFIKIKTANYVYQGPVNIKGEIKNTGANPITSLTLNYSIDNGTPVTQSISSLNVIPFTEYVFTHSSAWLPPDTGIFLLKVWLSSVNGQTDANAANDTLVKTVIVKEAIPDIIPSYTLTGNTFTYVTIGTIANGVSSPRDLDFAPNGDLWVINRGSEATGGRTITFFNPGKPNQTSVNRKDGNAYHFMSLPTGIAFSDNENFATSTGVYDANHDGGTPFTGPTLWSSDSTVYAQPSGGNGSHLDMLHESPYCMGIAHEEDNAFWVFDGNSNDIVRYDFREDHGPGNDDHSDGIIRRYPEVSVSMINNDMVSHLVLEKSTGWLYIVDSGNKRILRLNTLSGTPGGTPTFGPFEPLAEYTSMTGATWEVVVDSSSGLVQPAGIDVLGNQLLVSDYSNGDIIIYDIASIPATELGRVQTGAAGIMGIVIGPDGRIWYVNNVQHKVFTIEPFQIIINSESKIHMQPAMHVYPNPSSGWVSLECKGFSWDKIQLTIYDVFGKEIFSSTGLNGQQSEVDFSYLPSGMYLFKADDGKNICTRKVVIKK